MPFTFFHAAVVLPARYLPGKWKKYVSTTGLITGSVAPDFEKFLQMKGGNTYSHTLAGMFGFDLPMALMLAVIFHRVVKNVLIDYLPANSGMAARFSAYKNQNWMQYLQHRYVVVVISMLLGIASHLVLDSATHANGVLVRRLPLLSNYYDILSLHARGYQVLETVYYLLAVLTIYGAFAWLPQRYALGPARRKKAFFWAGVAVLSSLVICLRLLVNPHIRHIWDLASLLTAAGLAGLLLSCLVWRWVARV